MRKKTPPKPPKNVLYLVDKTGNPVMADPVHELELYLEAIYAGKIKRPSMMILIMDDGQGSLEEPMIAGLDHYAAVPILEDTTFALRLQMMAPLDD